MSSPPGGRKWKVAVLGATGAVGQTFIRLLANHPWFELSEVAASERSSGKRYAESARWLEGAMPSGVSELQVKTCDPSDVNADIVFSALDSSVAGEIEKSFAEAGKFVLSNAKNFRMDADVPLVIPEVNADHLALLDAQRSARGWKGAIITNANCAATVAAVALAPLHERFVLDKLFLTTMQAVSGAGYPGVASLDILGNVIPYIADEEPKLEREMLKLLGHYENGAITDGSFEVSAQTNRVAVEHGHTVCITASFRERPSPSDALETLREWKGAESTWSLPSRPEHPLAVTDSADRPQPRRDVNAGDGMTVTVGRVREDRILDLRMIALGHNTIRGAAGGSVLNAELLAKYRPAPRSVIVVKFGGTSVGDAEAIERAAAIVQGRLNHAPIVVVSALGGATNALLAVGEQSAKGHLIGALRGVENLRDRHLRECERLLAGTPAADDIASDLSAIFDELASLAEALSVLGHVTPRSLDAIAAFGEQASSQLVTAFFQLRGIPAEHLDAREVMITNSAFMEAEPQTAMIAERSRNLILPLVRDGKVPVLGGFIGANADGVTTTLGRGGSDYSASLIGAALHADAIEIWTDVDGMLTADPRLVDGALLIEEIRFDEASELASFGAKVLHPSTIAPAVRLGIPVFIYNSRRPEGKGTRITFDAPHRPVSAIAGKTDIILVKVSAPRMLLAHGFLRRVFEIFERHQTSVDVVATSEVSVSVTIDDPARLEALLVDLRELGDVSIERNRGIVAIVGAGICDAGGAMGRALIALGETKLHMMSLSATGINLTLIIDGDEVNPAIERLHDEFFGGDDIS